MTIDVDALLSESAAPKAQHYNCQTCRWLDSRPEAERAKWQDALEQPKTWPGAQIARAMAQVPPDDDDAPDHPSEASVQNHQRNKHPRH